MPVLKQAPSSYINRFIQPDSIIPNPANPQSFNRFSYVYNRPINFTDPSGHDAYWCQNASCQASYYTAKNDGFFAAYGVKVDDGYTSEQKLAIMVAISKVGRKFAETRGKDEIAAEAFKAVYGLNDGDTFFFEWDPNCWGCREDPPGCDAGTTKGDACVHGFGYTNTENWIEFASMSDVETPLRNINNVIHELGHAFNLRLGRGPENALAVRVDLLVNGEGFYGYPNNRTWEASSGTNGSETFADQFLGWVYGKWDEVDDIGRSEFMDQMNGANGWVTQAALLP